MSRIFASSRTSVSRPEPVGRLAGQSDDRRRRRRSGRARGRTGRRSCRGAPRWSRAAAGSPPPPSRYLSGERIWSDHSLRKRTPKAMSAKPPRMATRIAIRGVRRYGSSTFGSGGRKLGSGCAGASQRRPPPGRTSSRPGDAATAAARSRRLGHVSEEIERDRLRRASRRARPAPGPARASMKRSTSDPTANSTVMAATARYGA